MYLLTTFAYKPVSKRALDKIANSDPSKKVTIINKVNREVYNRDENNNATSVKQRPKRETISATTSQRAVKQAALSDIDIGFGTEPKYKYSDTISDIKDSISYTVKGKKYYQAKGELDKAKEYGDNLKEHQKMLKQWKSAGKTNTTNTAKKVKTKLLTNKKLAIAGGALVATGILGAAINKLRKSRKDKGKLRGKYRKLK